jgi:WD repeat-containing protein 68
LSTIKSTKSIKSQRSVRRRELLFSLAAMPFHQQNAHAPNTPAAGIYQAAQALGSFGAPTGNLRVATSGTTSAGTDALMPSSGNTLGRSAEELHLDSADPYAHPSSSAPPVNLNPYHQQASGNHVPGSLQPGSNLNAQQQQQQQRPSPSAAYTAPSTVPTMPNLNTNAQQYTLPTRSNTMSQPHSSSHAYSRSSPAGLGPEQKYIPFSNTPENPKYAAATPAQKYYGNTPSGAASNSPLGLDDIRPRANSSINDEGAGARTLYNENVDHRVPSNSNYLAPWSVYAFDWCKWNVHGGNSAGKMAIGSYLEDTHNFVRCRIGSCLY